MTSPDTPVIIGVGQFAERSNDAGYRGLSPMDLAGLALDAAISDCESEIGIAPHLDTIAAIRQFEISTPNAIAPFGKSDNPPRSIAKRVGATPARAILEIVGGQGPQKLVGELAADIAGGVSEMAAVVGSEAISTALLLAKSGQTPDWSESIGGQIEDRGFGMSGLIDKNLIDHGLIGAIPSYALFENARRAREGLSLDAYRQRIGELFAPFSRAAAGNPYAASRVERTASELAEVTERNRIVAEPYTRMTVSRDQVNQAAAIILCSQRKADKLGVPQSKRIHIHAVVDAQEASVLERADLAIGTKSRESVQTALDLAGRTLSDIAYLDLYSCFAIPVFNILDEFELSPSDPRGLTLTGGLPFFGGAGNNYSSHAIAEAVIRLRKDPEAFALVGANGGFMSKYATGIYSAKAADWSASSPYKKLENPERPISVCDSYEGLATLESYTLIPRKGGMLGAAVVRTPNGSRALAIASSDDHETLTTLAQGDVFGRSVNVSRLDDRRNRFEFGEKA